jgi:hypothetical protein
MSSLEKIDFFELGDKTSLICVDPKTTDVAKTTLRDLGYKYHTAETPELAIERMRYSTYDCIVVHENFAGSSLRSNAVLNYLAPLPMAQRRYSFVSLVGSSFKTLDAMQAFAQNVHLVLNPWIYRISDRYLRRAWPSSNSCIERTKTASAKWAKGKA